MISFLSFNYSLWARWRNISSSFGAFFFFMYYQKKDKKKKEKLIKASITNLHFIKCQYRILILRNHYMLAKEILLLGKEILLHFFIARSPLWILFILHGLYFVHLQYVVFSFPSMIYSLMLNVSKIIFFTFL